MCQYMHAFCVFVSVYEYVRVCMYMCHYMHAFYVYVSVYEYVRGCMYMCHYMQALLNVPLYVHVSVY